jgi:CPA2 family monovalent cation:H+ antiporter-2
MHDLPLITTIAAAFAAAWVLGILAKLLKLSPIVGYLLAGIAIGPHTPGFVGDAKLAHQLAEIGVILLMFGVGLHFHLADLLAVKNVAVPGALGQSLVATVLGCAVGLLFGFGFKGGLVLGMAMAVASTVVLIRVLTDRNLLDTTHGHVAVGWLIVEDVLTVIVLVLIPALGTAAATGAGAAEGAAADAAHAAPAGSLWWNLFSSFGKLTAFVALLFVVGSKVVPWVMVRVAKLRSRELFTLTVLVMAVAVATGAYYAFGASMALGAFLAGMVVGQSPVSHQAAADALPLRDAFAVLFFASVGMLFDPMFVVNEPLLLLAGLGIVLVGKPLAAMVIVAAIGYPVKTALVVALGLAQIGEFSFILSELARQHGVFGDKAHNLLVAVAIASITINPFLFSLVGPAERWLRGRPMLWRLMTARSARRETVVNAEAEGLLNKSDAPLAVVLGYGPVGRTLDELLRRHGLETVVVDLNMATVEQLTRAGRAAIYGDAYNIEVMSKAMERATHLVVTLPHAGNRNPLIAAAKLINPEIKVIARARYIAEGPELRQAGADGSAFEEAEVAVALSKLVLADRGVDGEQAKAATDQIREKLTVAAAGAAM